MGDNTSKIEQKAINTGILDGFLTILFVFLGQVAAYVITLLPFLDTFQQGRYSWVKFPLGILLAAAVKGFDRKKHEDTSPSNGLVSL